MSFSIAIGAKDQTKGALSQALSGFRSFASTISKPLTISLKVGQAGLGLLRDINLGLRPLVSGLDNLIEKGSALEVVRKSFESLTGTAGRQSDMMARRIVNAASGTLQLADAMRVANRALGSGLQYNQLLTAIEFIGKKSITTGKDARAAIDTVITGLSRGSTLFLDDFGILVDGIEGVKRSFDGIKGAGAFDSLGPAAQKAETVRQAVVEMQQQMGKIGVSGNETVFIFQGLKNQISDAVDSLTAGIAKSEGLSSALKEMRDVAAGLTAHFEAGGGLWDVIFGKGEEQGGKSGGILGVLKAGVMDLGELAGRSILGGVLKGISLIPQAFTALKDAFVNLFGELKPIVVGAIKEGVGFLKQELQPVLNLLNELRGGVTEQAESWLSRLLVGENGLPTGLGKSLGIGDSRGRPKTIPGAMIETFEEASKRPGDIPAATIQGATAGLKAMFRGFGYALDTLMGNPPKNPQPMELPGPISMLGSGNPHLMALQVMGLGSMAQKKKKETLFQLFGSLGDKLLGGGIKGDRESRVAAEFRAFKEDFAPPDEKNDRESMLARGEQAMPLTLRSQDLIRQQIAMQRRRLRNLMVGGAGARQEALKRTGERIAGLRRQGFSVAPSDRRRIFQELLKEATEERAKPVREGIEGMEARLRGSREARSARQTATLIQERRRLGLGGNLQESLFKRLDATLQRLDAATAAMGQVARALTGGEGQLAAIGNR